MMHPMDGNQRKSRNVVRVLFIVLLISMVIGVVVAGKRAWTAGRARQTILSNGTRVELLGTTVGNTTFTTDNKWQSIARRYLPGRFQSWLPAATTGTCGYSSNSVTVYVSVTSPTGTPVTSPPWDTFMTEDQNGFCYPRGGGYCSFGGMGSSKVYGFTLLAYPRREREFLFHMMDAKGVVMGSLRVLNPLSGAFPEWKALPLPQTQTNGPVILTLKGMEEQGNQQWRSINPTWRVEATDPAWVKAHARSQILSDSTGNTSYQILSPREAAWKLRTLVYRSRLQDFTTNEIMVVTNLAVPAAGNFVSMDQSADCAGVKIKLLAVAGAGSLTLSNGVPFSMSPTPTYGNSSSSDGRNTTETWGNRTPFMVVEAQNAQDGDEIEFHVRDENGQEIKVQSNGYGGSSGIRKCAPNFTVPEGVKSLSVQIVVNRPVPFEFMVNPAEVVRKK